MIEYIKKVTIGRLEEHIENGVRQAIQDSLQTVVLPLRFAAGATGALMVCATGSIAWGIKSMIHHETSRNTKAETLSFEDPLSDVATDSDSVTSTDNLIEVKGIGHQLEYID